MAETSAAAAGPGTDQSLTWVPRANRLVGAHQGTADAVRLDDDRRQIAYGTGAFLINRAFSQLCDEMRALPVKSDVLELWMQPICSIAGTTNSSVTCSNQPHIQDESPYLSEYQGISRADNLSRADSTYGTEIVSKLQID